jgi:anaerobic ribonucleoside-triphosphate reductase
MTEITNMKNGRTRCEVYSRVVGYIRPVNQWNEGKQAEYADRVEFRVDGCESE